MPIDVIYHLVLNFFKISQKIPKCNTFEKIFFRKIISFSTGIPKNMKSWKNFGNWNTKKKPRAIVPYHFYDPNMPYARVAGLRTQKILKKYEGYTPSPLNTLSYIDIPTVQYICILRYTIFWWMQNSTSHNQAFLLVCIQYMLIGIFFLSQ